ncbi:interleukin 21 receptor, tandem duplicate 1 isoform X1 [Carassius carassius]|uniref:interleukin 21 receptor, tandem duplicate 1 isoform X1 n=1 Tax=Carassius carassius TaxID=217509 RepID=UPI0028696D29|nr:interleukin 21 receptor, tandem duplicate 1 isoform X1 [Carassius carassius]XP_059414587.1 interleukin 21 receptor, tandem duplicate 1 isoform X1 [Carassius carassius]
MHLSRADCRFVPCSSMMALWQAIALLVICGLTECSVALRRNATASVSRTTTFPLTSLFADDGVCSVTCTTDFISMLNCSNSDSAGAASCLVEADCRDEYLSANGSCSIKSPQSWCTMEPNDVDCIMSYDTNCSIIVTQMAKQGNMETPTKSHSETILLYKFVKPIKPFNLNIKKIDDAFNLTWDVAYTGHELCTKLYYRVRLRSKSDPDEMAKIYPLQQNQQSMVIISKKLLPGRQYEADVQVAVDPKWFTSMWSEWSNSVEWTSDSEHPESEQYYFLLLALPVLVVVLLVSSAKLGGIKKLSLWQHIPSPHEYFTPLYHTYQGDFKKWVGPVLTFNSFDVLEKSTTLQVLCEKQQNESSEEPASSGPVGQNSSKLYFLGSKSQSIAHSGGHISIDTVTVSGQEGVVADWSGDSHRRSLKDFLNDKDANQRAAEIDARQPLIPDGRRSLQGSDCDDWHLQEHDLENIEQVSLDSYVSNEQSDDGYPQMGLDLDTIDSGFLESDCSSPSAFDGNEQIDTSSLDGVGRSHSNYVKQWVTFTSVQVDAHSTGN